MSISVEAPTFFVAKEVAEPVQGTLSMVMKRIQEMAADAARRRDELTGDARLQAEAELVRYQWQSVALDTVRDERQSQLMGARGYRPGQLSHVGSAVIDRFHPQALHMPIFEVGMGIDRFLYNARGNPDIDQHRMFAADLKARLAQLAH